MTDITVGIDPCISGLVAQLVAFRRARGIMAGTVARRLHVTPAAVSNFEHGRHPPQLATITRYAAAVGARITFTIEDAERMTTTAPRAPGKYVRTPEIRAKSRAHARPGVACEDDCTCGRHRSQAGHPKRKCAPGCTCGKHTRTPQHNTRIGMSVALTAAAKRLQRGR